MAELTDAQIDAALERGRTAQLHEPRAASARYDRQSEQVIVELTIGCIFAFRPKLAQGADCDRGAIGSDRDPGNGPRAALGSARRRSVGFRSACRLIRDESLLGSTSWPDDVPGQVCFSPSKWRQRRTSWSHCITYDTLLFIGNTRVVRQGRIPT